uniref:Uncharacterized protein n=1 Tax=Spongospora subterranea TaxID=70186 RepID=A0A0H5R3V1_9EUKA|eukprot:CRZ08803.1 hypothetical protein [Spongospora subterranea]
MSDLPLNSAVLDTFPELWTHITLWTVAGVGTVYLCAGIWACCVISKPLTLYLWVPLLSAFIGALLGFASGGLSALLIAAIYVSIPYSIGIDVAAGLGIGQAAVITYFHLGRFSGTSLK